MSVIPDFGFNPEIERDNDQRGWSLVYEGMQDLKKYERVGNYIEFKKHFLKEKEKAKLKEQKAKR
jgi:hypothetical protein